MKPFASPSWAGLRASALLLLVALFGASSLLLAQTQGRLGGTVTDTSGAVIPGAPVVLRNVETGVEQAAETNESGVYQFPYVTPGAYELRVEFEGFKTYAQTGITLETGYTRTVDVSLEVGQIAEVVNVEAATPLLESATSSVGQFIEREQVFNMPVQSRRSASLVRLMGNVTYRSEDGGEQIPKFAMAGGRSQNQMWTLDGSVVQNMSIGVPQLALNPPAESLQEFKAEQNNYPAEFGRAGGGAIVMTTRSGGNEFHGAVYEFFRNDAMDSRSFFAPDVAPLRYNIFGGSLGGPIKRNKSFFFFNYEGARRRDGVTHSGDDVPHVPEKTGNFSNRANLTLRDPLGGTFPNNTIPQNRLDPLGRQIAQLYPDPNVSTPLSAAPANNYIGNVSNSLDQNFVTAKWDHNAGDNDRLSVRFIWVEAPEVIAALFPNEFADPRAGTRANRHHNTTINWIHNFSPTKINEFRFNWGDRLHINRGAGFLSGKNGELGIPGVNPEAFANFTVNGLSQLGITPHERIQDPIRTVEIANNQTWIRGAHQIKFGGTMRYARNIDNFSPSTGGIFGFNNRATNVGTAELLLGHVNNGALVETDQLDTRTDYFGFFVQDDWKASSKLSLNLGLRWEFDTPRWERDNHQSGFDWAPINPVSGTPGIVTFAGQDGVGKYSHDTYLGAFNPRFGFAYQLDTATVLRGGYGINYYGAYNGAVPNAMSLGFGLNGNFTSPDGGFTRAFPLASGMPAIAREPLGPAFGAVPFGSAPRTAPDYIEANHRNAMAQQWNFGIQRQLPMDYLLELTYTANMGHRLGGQNMNWNQIPLVNGRGPAAQNQRLRLFPQFNNVTQISPDWGNSAYHSGNLKIEKRYTGGFNMLLNYTWSKYLDDVEGGSELAGHAGNAYTHFQLRHLDRSYSGSDIRHRVAASAVYELPWGRDRKFNIQNKAINAILGGWGIGLITEFRTGSSYAVIENTNTSNTFSSAQRPNILGNPEQLDNWRENVKGAPYFDPALFAAPGTGVFGDAPRAVCCGPGLANVDASVHKWFSFTERWRLQFRGDFYNLPNHPAFAVPSTSRGGPGFATVSSTLLGTGGRVTQLSLRLEF